MKNNFAEELKIEKRIKAEYEEAERNGNAEGMDKARTEINDFMEKIEGKGVTYAKNYRLYRDADERGNEYIDWDDLLGDDEIEGFINGLRECGIEKFTLSSTWSNAIKLAWLFTQNGCAFEGFLEINDRYKSIFTREYEKKPACLFSIR